MSTIFLVRYRGGEYDEAFDNVIRAWSTRELAEAHQLALTAVMNNKRAMVKALDEACDQVKVACPSPQYPTHLLQKPVKWPAGMRQQDITDEMRAQRTAIREHNAAVSDAYNTQQSEWYDANMVPAIKKVMEKFGVPYSEYNPWHTCPTADHEYHIEELEMD